MDGRVVWRLWLTLVVAGVGIALATSKMMTAIALAFAAQGLAYNVPPLRTKDVPYLDVLSESVNNPLRLAIGWAMIDPGSLPRSDERRGGKEWGSTCRSLWLPYH